MSLENIRQLSVLTALQELYSTSALRQGSAVGVDHSSLTDLVLPPSLTKLELTTSADKAIDLALLSASPAGLKALDFEWNNLTSPLGLEWLLPRLGRLQCLTQLDLAAWPHDTYRWPPPGPAYSALTASSGLVSLKVDAAFPAGVWPFVFQATHPLPHLTSVAFGELWTTTDAAVAWGPGELASLVSCCPCLCDIRAMCLQHGQYVSELHKLTALKYLDSGFIAGDTGDAVDTVEGLAAVTQLQAVDAHLRTATAPVTVAHLLPLTRLTALTHLVGSYGEEEVYFKTKAGSPPDVWLQLLEHCAAEDPACQPAALRGLAQQLAEQQALTHQQIADLQQQLHQQNAAAQQVATEQAGRIAALEGQLQQLMQRLL